MENKIREKDKEIERLLNIQSNSEKVRRDQEKEIDMFQSEFNYKGKVNANDPFKILWYFLYVYNLNFIEFFDAKSF